MNLELFYPEKFNEALLQWFRVAQRPMPWRLTKDPYAIMVSEFMLQQTQVATVIPYYLRFMQRFPTLYELAQAPEEEVLTYWAGLGYYSRVRNLLHACQQIVTDFQGRFPTDYEAIRSLKGVGDYTAGAIRSIAFEQATPAVDGNVMRVFSRLTGDHQDIGLEKTKQQWRRHILQWMDHQHSSEYTQGLMELGATVCTPKNPNCERCPVQQFCWSFAHQQVSHYPVKAKRVKIIVESYDVLWITNGQQQVVIEQRPATGLLARQWQLPMQQISSSREVSPDYRHQFSHRIWNLYLVSKVQPDYPLQPHQKWGHFDEIKTSLITAHQRLLDIGK